MHVIGPELGLTQPGMTIVCGDSHTTTHGAFGALAFGIGTTEVEQVLATQCLVRRKPKAMLVVLDGTLAPGVSAKDAALAVVGTARHGRRHRSRHRVRRQPRVRAVDGTAHDALQHEHRGRRHRGDRAARRSDVQLSWPGAGSRRRTCAWPAARVAVAPAGERSRRDVRSRRARSTSTRSTPLVTWGTRPDMVVPITGAVPDPGAGRDDARTRGDGRGRSNTWRSTPGTPMTDVADRSRLHRLVHQRAPRGSARRGARRARPSRQRPRAGDGRARLGAGQGRRRARRARSHLPRGRLRMARAGLLDVPRHEPRHPASRASDRRRPATAISKGVRAAADARTWSARRWRPRRPSRGHFADVRGWEYPLMQPFRRASRAASLPLLRRDVDTDQIIPKQFLKSSSARASASYLFNDWRIRRRRRAATRRSCSTSRATPARRFSSPAPTSAAARRASTPPGRSPTTASARSSRRRSPTSSAATRSPTDCCRVVLPEATSRRSRTRGRRTIGYALEIDLGALPCARRPRPRRAVRDRRRRAPSAADGLDDIGSSCNTRRTSRATRRAA